MTDLLQMYNQNIIEINIKSKKILRFNKIRQWCAVYINSFAYLFLLVVEFKPRTLHKAHAR